MQPDHQAQVNAMSEAGAEAGLPVGQRMQLDKQLWEKTQIASKFLIAELNGGLVSTDPQRVKMAATIASNMLINNENAFAGTANQKNIEAQAWEFLRLQRNGLSADDAVKRIAGMNDPETKARLAPKNTEVQKFREELTKKDLSAEILKDFNPGFFSRLNPFNNDPRATSLGLGDTQVRAVEAQYKELMIEHYGEFGNIDQAKSYAMNKLNQQYGISNNRLMQYAPEKAPGYPAINGSKKWVYEEAAHEISGLVGKPIKPENIVFDYSYGQRGGISTRDAFVNGQPVPYTVKYWTMSEAGFPIMEQLHVPQSRDGVTWYADINRYRERVEAGALASGVKAGLDAVRGGLGPNVQNKEFVPELIRKTDEAARKARGL